MTDPTVKLEVFRSPSGIITVCTHEGGGGTRLSGVKLLGSGSAKIAEFLLNEGAVGEIVEALQRAKESYQ